MLNIYARYAATPYYEFQPNFSQIKITTRNHTIYPLNYSHFYRPTFKNLTNLSINVSSILPQWPGSHSCYISILKPLESNPVRTVDQGEAAHSRESVAEYLGKQITLLQSQLD